MKPIVLTFAGRIASGKSTLSRQIAVTLRWPWASFGDYVRAEAKRCGFDPTSRTALQQVSERLLNLGWHPFCRSVLDEAQWVAGTCLVLDGIRHGEALSTLRDLVSPHRVALVFVDTPDRVREERLRGRGISSEEQRSDEQHESETQARDILIGFADIVIDGTLPLDEATQTVLNWMTNESAAGSRPTPNIDSAGEVPISRHQRQICVR